MKNNIRKIYTLLTICLLSTLTNSFANADAPILFLLSIGATPPAIQYTVEDALDFADTFENQAGKSGIYREVVSKTLTGKYANAENIKKEIRILSQQQKMSANDLIVLFISSHGFMDKDNFWIQASDFASSKPSQTSVALMEIVNMLESSKARKLIFMDACSSGGDMYVGNSTTAPNDDDYASVYDKPTIVSTESITRCAPTRKRDIIKPLDYNKHSGTTIITSSIGNTKSYYHNTWKNGAFTEALIEGFNGKADSNDNQTITLGELFEYVRHRVPQLCKEQRIKNIQRPDRIRNGLGDDFPIFNSQYQLLMDNSHKQLSYLLNIQPAEPASQTRWVHNSEALFDAHNLLVTGEAAFMGKGHLIHLKIKTTIQGNYAHIYDDKQLPPDLTLYFNNGEQIQLNGTEHFTMYSKKLNKTQYIMTFTINKKQEETLIRHPLESITIDLEKGLHKYPVNYEDALKKQLNLIQMARKEKLIPTKIRQKT